MIEWFDSFGCSSNWSSLTLTEAPRPQICKSVGWLLHDGDDCKVVVPHLSDSTPGIDPQGCGDMTIPSIAIKSITEIPYPSAPFSALSPVEEPVSPSFPINSL